MNMDQLFKKIEIEALLYRYSTILDNGQFDDWTDMFVEDCKYKVITVDNYEKGYLLGIMDDNKNRMRDRVEVIRKWWNVEDAKHKHCVTNIQVNLKNNKEATCESYLSIYETNRFGQSKLLCVGRYLDKLEYQNDTWKFKERLAVLDTHLLTEIFIPI